MCSVVVPTTDMIPTADSQTGNSDREEESKATKRKISLSTCGVCGSEEAKYRCPACLGHSCSLQCVKKHKEDLGCSGIRNKTAFVPVSQFDEMALLSDYRFLEDTGRFADGTTRDKLIRTPRSTGKTKKLTAWAQKMNITLKLLPVTFTRSRENSTFFLTKDKIFLWHLKLIFPQSSTEFSQRGVSDKKTLEDILTPYIHPTESDPVKRQKLKMYVHAPFDDVKIFMKAEGRKANSVRYHEMNIKQSLRDSLSYKTLIEYPVLHVVLRDRWEDYPLKEPAVPASACNSFARPNKQERTSEEGVIGATAQGTGIRTEAREPSPETEPPKEKRAKREMDKEEELEDGELTDSSDDGEREEPERDGEGVTCDQSPAGDVKEEPEDSCC